MWTSCVHQSDSLLIHSLSVSMWLIIGPLQNGCSVTTPEKFDSITRRNKSRGGMAFFGEVALLLIGAILLLIIA